MTLSAILPILISLGLIAAVSALDTTGDGALVTLETVRKRYPNSKAGGPYEAVWNRFFPDERSK